MELSAAHALVQTVPSTACDISNPIIQTELRFAVNMIFCLATSYDLILQINACWSQNIIIN